MRSKHSCKGGGSPAHHCQHHHRGPSYYNSYHKHCPLAAPWYYYETPSSRRRLEGQDDNNSERPCWVNEDELNAAVPIVEHINKCDRVVPLVSMRERQNDEERGDVMASARPAGAINKDDDGIDIENHMKSELDRMARRIEELEEKVKEGNQKG